MLNKSSLTQQGFLLVFIRSTEFYSSIIQVMDTQGISVDSQVLIDASNTLKVNAFFSSLMEQFVINLNLNYFKNFWSRSREGFPLFFCRRKYKRSKERPTR